MVQKIKAKFGRTSFVITVSLLLIFAIAIVVFFSTRIRMPDQMRVCGVDLSHMSAKDAQAILSERVNNYSMRVTVDDQFFEITADELGLVFLKDEFESVIRTSVKTDTDVNPWSLLSLDQDKLRTVISLKFDQRRTESAPATVAWDDGEGCFKVIEGTPESWYDVQKLAEQICAGVASLREELVVPEQLLYTELDNSEQFACAETLAMRANEVLELEQEYVFNPRKVKIGRIVIDGDMIASFLRIDSVNETIDVDRDAVLTYVKNISDVYHYFRNEDRFVTHEGDRVDIDVPVEPQTVDTQLFAALIADNILSGTSGSFEVPYSGARNFDGTYVEVSIPQQRLWVYMDGEVALESDIVSGNRGAGKRSPTGLYYIRGHLRNIYLMDAYFVNYWMTITLGGRYGFHDADGWRTPEEYGGDTYLTNGSGGCINVPGEKISIMYDLVPDTTPVVIYNEFYYD